MERSDKYRYMVDLENGIGAIPLKNAPQSYVNEESKSFGHVEIPYSFKLLTQELNALGIQPKFAFDNKKEVDEYFEDDGEDVDQELTE